MDTTVIYACTGEVNHMHGKGASRPYLALLTRCPYVVDVPTSRYHYFSLLPYLCSR